MNEPLNETRGPLVRVELPAHLRTLAGVGREVQVRVAGEVTLGAVLDELEARWPVLKGTIRDHTTKQRRPFLRFFACEQDLSLGGMDQILPERVVQGEEALLVIGAVAGG